MAKKKPESGDVLSINDLQLDQANVRKHGERNLNAIKASLSRFKGWRSIAITGDNRIVAGNGTVEAARASGEITEVLVVEPKPHQIVAVKRSDMSNTEATAYAIADNRTAELADWDESALTGQLLALQDDDFDLDAVGFTDAEIDALKAQLAAADFTLPDEESLPELPENPVTQPGQLWLLGKHRLLCGDSTNAADVERLMSGKKPLMMITDPPYGVKLDMTWRNKALPDHAPSNPNLVTNDDRADWTEAWELFPGDICYVWHASAFSDVVTQSLRNAGFNIVQQLIWNKTIMVMGRCDYHFKHEPCWYAVRKGKTHRWTGDRKQVTVIDAKAPAQMFGTRDEEKTPHPTQKPLECMAYLMKNHPGDVYDPFCGSGTTLIAAQQLNKTCYGMELSPAYCDIIIQRWEKLTNGKAVLGE